MSSLLTVTQTWGWADAAGHAITRPANAARAGNNRWIIRAFSTWTAAEWRREFRGPTSPALAILRAMHHGDYDNLATVFVHFVDHDVGPYNEFSRALVKARAPHMCERR